MAKKVAKKTAKKTAKTREPVKPGTLRVVKFNLPGGARIVCAGSDLAAVIEQGGVPGPLANFNIPSSGPVLVEDNRQ